MSIVDPISDMLTRIRNAYQVGKPEVVLGTSKAKLAILAILKKHEYVHSFVAKDGQITVVLNYKDQKPAIDAIERISRPGRRIYVKNDEIPTVLSGQGIALVSTSKGVMTGDDAKKQKLGGELICRVY